MIAPDASRTMMVAPTSPVPLIDDPSVAMVALGAAGAVRSGALMAVGSDTLPAASICVTDSGSPSTRGGDKVTL